MTDAELFFNESFKRALSSWSTIFSFSTATRGGMETASKKIEQEVRDFADGALGTEKRPFMDAEEFHKSGELEHALKGIVASILADASNSIDGACVLFSHSVLDAVAFDYCRVTSLLAPKDWDPSVEKRKFELAELRAGRTYDDLLKSALDEYFDKLERESLLKKIDLLYSKCQPPSDWSGVKNYKFDRSHLENLDTLRHEIVHRDGLGRAIPNAEKEIEYMFYTYSHLTSLVTYKYSIKIDYKRIFPRAM